MKTKILLIAALLSLSSCYYFRVIPEVPYTVQSIRQYEDTGKILILHREENAWHLYDVDSAENMLSAKLDIQLGYHVKYLNPEEGKLNKFDKPLEPEVVNTIHLYTSDSTFNSLDTVIAIPLSSIYYVSSYEYARAPSRASKIVPIVVLPVVGVVVVSLIAISSMDWNMDIDLY